MLTFGPYNRILPIWQNNARIALSRRPVVIHWNTEGMPDLRIPPKVVRALGAMRSKIGRMATLAWYSTIFFIPYDLFPILINRLNASAFTAITNTLVERAGCTTYYRIPPIFIAKSVAKSVYRPVCSLRRKPEVVRRFRLSQTHCSSGVFQPKTRKP